MLISGVTVLIAMAGMLLAGSKIFTSIGIGAMLVVFMSLVGSLTVLPALLGKLGDRDRARHPPGARRGRDPASSAAARAAAGSSGCATRRRCSGRLKGDRQESRIWGVVLRRLDALPARSRRSSAGGVLVLLALPVFSMHTKLLSFSDLPHNLAIVKTYDKIQAAFPGSPAPAHLVVKARRTSRRPQFQRAYADFKQRALATGEMHQPIQVAVNPDKTVARIDMPLAGNGEDAAAYHALNVLRNDVIPPVLGTLPAGRRRSSRATRRARTTSTRR